MGRGGGVEHVVDDVPDLAAIRREDARVEVFPGPHDADGGGRLGRGGGALGRGRQAGGNADQQ